MKLMTRVVYLAAILAVVAGPFTASRASGDEVEKVIEYFRKKANVPPNLQVKVVDLKDSPIQGLKQGMLEVSNKRQAFLLSSDGRYAVFGSVDDLNVDPYDEVMQKISLKGRFTKGPADAKVTIVEYSDFQCPYCARGYNTIEKEVLKEYGDKVRFVYKHFPLNFHKWAESGAVAVECAAKQSEEAYWKLYSALFENQKEITPENLKDKSHEFLSGVKVDQAKFDQCLDDRETLPQVKADQQEGAQVGVSGTPAFIINGRLLSGAQPFQNFKAIIDDELASN